MLLVGTPALALGAVHPPILSLYLFAAVLTFGVLVVSRRYPLPPLDLVGGGLMGLALFTALQSIPLPPSLVEALAPAVYEVRSRALAPLASSGLSWMPLTLDVTLTAAELGKLLLYLAVYWLTLAYARRHGPRFVLSVVIGTGLAATAVFLAHRILLLDKLYGFYTPRHLRLSPEGISAPLVNANHMAGLLGLTTAAAIGRALSFSERSHRALSVGIAALLGGALMLTLSRGGIMAFVAGQCLFILLRILCRKQQRARRASIHLAWLPMGLAVSLGLGFFVAQDAIIGEFLGGNIKKLDLAFEGLPLIGRFWTTGVGRGAFWVGFPLVSDLTIHKTFTHAENAVIQLLADWGVIVGGGALLLSVAVIGRHLREIPKRTELTAAVAALVGFGIHNLVDFNVEIPGVAVIAVALVGVLNADRVPTARRARRRVPGRALGSVAAAGTAAALGMVLYFGGHSVDADEQIYRNAWNERDGAVFETAALTTVLRRHPADWYLPFIVGVRHYHYRTGNPLPWLARAVELNASSAAAHFYIGRTLLGAGYLSQAMLELRLATRFNGGLATPVAKMLVAHAPRFETLADLAVTREDRLLLWSALGRELAVQGYEEEAEKADRAVLEIDPKSPMSLARHIRRLAGRGETARALALAETLSEVPDFKSAGTILTAEILEKTGKPMEAVRVLERALEGDKNHPGLLTSLALYRQRAGDHSGAQEAARILKAVSPDAKSRAAATLLEAQLALGAGRVQEALARYREAHLADRSNITTLMSLARLAKRHGDTEREIEALRELRRLRPDDEGVRQRLSELEKQGKLRRHGLDLP